MTSPRTIKTYIVLEDTDGNSIKKQLTVKDWVVSKESSEMFDSSDLSSDEFLDELIINITENVKQCITYKLIKDAVKEIGK